MEKKIFINEYTYSLVLIIISISYYLSIYSGNAFEWPTNAELPVIARLENSAFLLNDFYTNTAVSSPKIIFSYLIYFLASLGLDYNLVLYLLKFCSVILTPALMFVTYIRIAKKYFYKEGIKFLPSQFYFLIFIMSLPIFGFIQGIGWDTPFGWVAIQTTVEISPMKIAFFIGLLYLLVRFSKKNNKYGGLILMASFLIHPIMGIFNYLIVLTLYFSVYDLRSNKKIIIYDFIFGIFIPLIFLLNVFGNTSYLSNYEFYKIYVEQRHPHHFLVTEILNLFSVLWIILITSPLILSIKIKSKKMITISSLILILIFLSVFLQYLFSEIYPLKFMMQLGVIRFTSYMSILWSINIILLLTHVYIHNQNNHEYKRLLIFKNDFNKVVSIFDKFLFFIQENIMKTRISHIFLIIVIIGIAVVSYEDPLTVDTDRKTLTHWIKNNTNEDSILFSKDMDTVFIRTYAQRAIFADSMMPFSEKHFQEYSEKLDLFRKIENGNIHVLLCKEEYNEIDFIVTASNNSFIQPIFQSGNWYIYDANKINCNKY